MSIEIKFRAWDKIHKKMFKVKAMDFVLGSICEDLSMNLEDDSWKISDSVELMQFTGLKDKNGKEIYEGDIVKRFKEDENFERVIWNDFNCRVWNERDLEVIGNIYENPELLTNKI